MHVGLGRRAAGRHRPAGGAACESGRRKPDPQPTARDGRRPWPGSQTARSGCRSRHAACGSSSDRGHPRARRTPRRRSGTGRMSSSRTEHASTRSRLGSEPFRSSAKRRRNRGNARANETIRSNLARSRRSRQRSWYRYCFRPASSIPVACRCPRGSVQIQTSRHAGGIARSRTRSSVSSSVMRSPRSSRYSNPRPRPRRRSPGPEQSDRRNRPRPAMVVTSSRRGPSQSRCSGRSRSSIYPVAAGGNGAGPGSVIGFSANARGSR